MKLKRTFAAILVSACLVAATPVFAVEAPSFSDVPVGSEYAAGVEYVVKNGLMVGYGNGMFGVNDPLTTTQLDVILKRYAGEDAPWPGNSGIPTSITRGRFAMLLSQAKGDALSIAEQGMFSSGGTVTEPVPGTFDETTNWLDATRAGNTAHVDHANVFYQIPENSSGNPIVYLHGYGQSRMGWMTTPDGRDGWSDIFLKKGHAAFLVDQPRRGEAGAAASMSTMESVTPESKDYQPGDQAWYTHFRIGRVAPERYEGSQFPAGDEVQDQFFRQMTPSTGDYDEALFGESLGAVLEDVYEMTGQKSIYITHSQGGRVGWATPTANMAAIVAIEPGGTPEIGSEYYQKLLDAKIPIIIYFGDYIDNGPEDIMSTGFWKTIRDGALAFAEQYNADGGDATVVDLPKAGITGNSHFMFQELNNEELADHLYAWLDEKGLN